MADPNLPQNAPIPTDPNGAQLGQPAPSPMGLPPNFAFPNSPTGPLSGQTPLSQNPFASALFDPQGSGLLGMIGRGMGLRTRDEMLLANEAENQREGFAAMGQRLASGMSVPAAWVDFMSSPEGAKFFTSSKDPMGAMNSFIQTQRPPILVTHPGDTGINPLTGQQMFHNPTGAVQDVTGLAEAAGGNPQQVQTYAGEIAQANLMSKLGLTSPEIIKTRLLMADGLDFNSALAITVGQMQGGRVENINNQLVPVPPQNNLNYLRPNAMPTGVGGVPIKPSLPGDAPGPGDQGYVAQPPTQTDAAQNFPKYFGNDGQGSSPLITKHAPGDIILNAGLPTTFAQAVTGLLGNANGMMGAAAMHRRQSLVEAITADARYLANVAGSAARGQNNEAIDTLLEHNGHFDDPVEFAEALKVYNEYLDNRLAADKYAIAHSQPDPKTGLGGNFKIVGDNQEDIYNVMHAKSLIPSNEDLDAAEKAYQGGPGAVATYLGMAAKNIGPAANAIGDSLTGTQHFATPADVQSAIANGTLTFPEGQTTMQVRVGDQMRTIHKTAPQGGGK